MLSNLFEKNLKRIILFEQIFPTYKPDRSILPVILELMSRILYRKRLKFLWGTHMIKFQGIFFFCINMLNGDILEVKYYLNSDQYFFVEL